MTPVRENILFKPFDGDSVSQGGIVVPDSCKAVSNKGVVVAVGNGSKKKPMRLTPGTIGYRVKDWGQEVLIDGEIHFIMTQESIIAIQ